MNRLAMRALPSLVFRFLLPVLCCSQLTALGFAAETQLPQDTVNHFYPQWSPDGNQFVYFRSTADNFSPIEIYTMSSSGGSETAITSGGGQKMHPQWSPDGGRIAYQKLDSSGVWQVCIAPSTGGGETVLTSSSYDHVYPQWSPNGAFLVYQRKDPLGFYQICKIPAAGGAEGLLTGDSQDHIQPQWSPLGNEIVYEKPDTNGYRQIRKVASDGGAETALTTESAYHGAPQWSPEGTLIAYHKGDLNTGVFQICTVPSTGGTKTALTSDAFGHFVPRWSPDGTYLLYSKADRTGYLQIYKIPVTGGSEIALTTERMNHFGPQWSVDGTQIVYFRYPPPPSSPIVAFFRVYTIPSSGVRASAGPSLFPTLRHGPSSPSAVPRERPGSFRSIQLALTLSAVFFGGTIVSIRRRPRAWKPRAHPSRSLGTSTRVFLVLLVFGFLFFLPRSAISQEAIPRFGVLAVSYSNYNFDILRKIGVQSIHVVNLKWSSLMPDGVHLDPDTIGQVDGWIRNITAAGLSPIMRVASGGGLFYPFSGIPDPEDWPVDTTNFTVTGPTGGYKYGEYLGNKVDTILESYPPKVLTLDEPGNTSPWYDYVSVLATRYNGSTPDPLHPGGFLPEVRYWALQDEQESKGFWYGTSIEYYGGLGGDPEVGFMPSYIRAVRAANPNAKILGGGILNLHSYALHEIAENGGITDRFHARMMDFSYTYGAAFNRIRGLRPDELLASMYTLEDLRADRFFDKSLEAAGTFDFYGYHAYTASHQYIRFIVTFLRQELTARGLAIPLWDSEMGSPAVPTSEALSRTEHAYSVFKGLALTFAKSATHVDYLMSDFPYFPGLFDILFQPQEAAKAFALLANKLDASRGFEFNQTLVSGRTQFHVFEGPAGQAHFAAAWYDHCYEEDGTWIPPGRCMDPDTETVDVHSVLGVVPSQFAVFDYLGRSSCGTSSVIDFSASPVLIAWGLDSDGDCVPDALDNCPNRSNSNQADTDEDQAGDVCDLCPSNFDPDQVDADADHSSTGCDCNDSDPSIHPGASEVLGDGIDSNCNGDDNCFIATAAFGSKMKPQVDLLRRFRDRVLLSTEWGKGFVEVYYEQGPTLARFLAEHSWLRSLVRILLYPVIGVVFLLP